jgi:two-component system cell cycle response regulator DivK
MAGELILIIEDNDKNLKLVRDVLQFNGYETAEAMTAEDGLVLARSRHPALILLDIQLPGMDGFAALRQLRADPITTSTPVMAVTASAMEQDRQKILAAGFDGYMTKPINVKRFIEEIRTVLVGLNRDSYG